METRKLYETDAYQTTFEAQVIGSKQIDGHHGVILDRTLFYASGGGQPHDTGTINTTAIVDVREQEDGIVHIADNPIPAGKVTGRINWQRRFDHMQQHTGQHLLSQAFVRELKADTIGFHLGETAATIDVSARQLNWEDIHRVEAEANRVVFANLAVRVHMATRETLNRFALRKPPAVAGPIRVVEIADYDFSACCGTHVRATGEIGLIKVLRFDKYKGDMRVTFACGKRALRAMQSKTEVLESVTRRLTLGEGQLVEGIQRLQDHQKHQQVELNALEKQLRLIEVRERVANARRLGGFFLVSDTIDDRDTKAVQALGMQITANPKTVCIFAVPSKRATLVVGQSEDGPLDLKALAPYAASLLDGKGGGNKRQIQVSGSDVSRLASAMRTISEHIEEKIEAAS